MHGINMIISEKLVKPVLETKYLTVDNADRYRVIMRLFFEKYEKLKYWLYQEEVYSELKKEEYFANYTMEQCQQDLKSLEGWGNLVTMQDTKNVATLEEFKNRKFRYQMSAYAVEIERMVLRLENLFIEGASLEPVLLERIRISLSKIAEIASDSRSKIYTWWNDLNNDFKRLNRNYQDYMHELNSLKAEEMMQTKAFLVYKDRLIEYLRTFVKSLQVNVGMIETYIKNVEEDQLKTILDEIVLYEKDIPRIDVEVDESQIRDKNNGIWTSIESWFVSTDGEGSEAGKVFDTTNEIIRKITRYAMRISERSNVGANRREEYQFLASMFYKCDTMAKAHRLSSMVFGVEQPLHLKGDFPRQTEGINSGVYEEEPAIVSLVPRIKTYREKSQKTEIVDRTEEKERLRRETLHRLEEEKRITDSYIKEGILDFATLPVIEPEVRDVFLVWLSKAFENKKRCGKTQDGRMFYIEEPKHENGEMKTCQIHSTDGVFTMPAYRLIFTS